LEKTGRKVKKIYGYFNNHFHGYAIENCIELMQMLKIAEPKHEKVKRKIIEYNLYGGSLSAGLSRTEREVWQLLLKLTDLNRVKRGRSIGDEELIIEESSEDKVRMRVKEYTVEFLLGERILRHDCDDWRKGLEEKRLCKHVVKALLSMKPERARNILEDIIKNRRFWRFQQL